MVPIAAEREEREQREQRRTVHFRCEAWTCCTLPYKVERSMPISGLVLTLDPENAALDRVIRVLQNDPRLTVGPVSDCKLPVVSETQAPDEAEALVHALMRLDGVRFVDVAFVDLSTDPEP